ncbi:MAG: alpha-2-macroglobulin family protein [Isosphaeraceae bacterium]
MRGKSTTQEIGIVPRDMPNMFVEALTVSGGKVFTQARQIVVPPESRIVDVRVEPSAVTYKPGQKAKVKVKLTGPDGKPFVGSTVLSVYDKAVEFISGGSNVPEIKEYFWKWKREHYPRGESSLDRWFSNLVKSPGDIMQTLGVFGGLEMDGARRADDNIALKKARLVGAGGGGAPMAMRSEARNARATLEMAPQSPMMAMSAAAPAPMAPAASEAIAADRLGEPGNPPPVVPVVRTNFADTAYWAAALSSSGDGTAEVEFTLPESLTTWKVRAWSMGAGTRVGQGQAEVITTKDLLVRLQAPRFFVQKDEVVLSANVHNKLKTKKAVQVVLETEGSVLELLGSPARTVEIDSEGEQRVDWRVKVAHEGQAIVRMKALTDEESDAAQMSFPAYVHGMLKMEAFAGAIRPDQDSAQITLRVPQERRLEQSRLEIRYSPTLAGAMVDALPYLADYPYGCTEQTLNRFLPTVITQNVLMRMGVDLKTIRDKRTNLNAQELGDAKERAQRWKSYEHNPVYDPAEVAKMATAGVARLADMQLSDGGWGWFSGYREVPSPHTTALVVHGLQLARQNDVTLPQGMLERGTAWLSSYQDRQVQLLHNAQSEAKPSKTSADDVDALVFMVLADADVRNESMLTYLDRDRTRLSVYAKALLGLALEKLGEKEKLALVLQNLRQYVVRDDENQTVHMKLPNEGIWWWWFGSEIETHAFTLKLLARTDPQSELASRLAKYLINNRRNGHYWGSTRDTAFCIEALADFLKASGEDRPDLTVSIELDGKTRKEVRITPEDLFRFDNALVIEGNQIDSGTHTLSFRKEGKGPLYWNAYLSNFTLEDPITHTGLEIKIDRKVYRLIRDDKTQAAAGGHGQATSERVEHYRREPLADGDALKSGDLVEIELSIDSKNDYEYLVFEDYKAAGFEPVEVRSGYNGNDLGAYVEFRDDRVAFFSRTLARGQHSVSYRLRAEVPGAFHALPARAQAMYAPELKANSDEIRLKVTD